MHQEDEDALSGCFLCIDSNQFVVLIFWQGPIHAYVAFPGGRTFYLSELQSGSEVLVVDAKGKSRPKIVGRVKIEARPLLLVEA